MPTMTGSSTAASGACVNGTIVVSVTRAAALDCDALRARVLARRAGLGDRRLRRRTPTGRVRGDTSPRHALTPQQVQVRIGVPSLRHLRERRNR
jgi:hypothetical protein